MKCPEISEENRIQKLEIPCKGVASHLQTTEAELRHYLSGTEIGDYLTEIVSDYSCGDFACSKVIWDISAVAYLINPNWLKSSLVHSPILTGDLTWSFDTSRHLIRLIHDLNRDKIFGDVFRKLTSGVPEKH